MADIPEIAEFVTSSHSLRIEANGGPDLITLRNLALDPETAAAVAWLANQVGDVNLKVKIKIDP